MMEELCNRGGGDQYSVADPDRPGLAVVRDLLGHLHDNGLRYCHWKSNEHVGAAVLGKTDLDVLVEPGRTRELSRILALSGFIRFQATAFSAYPAVEDYLAYDKLSGELVHLHLHYRLTLGEANLKGYRLPWEEEVLATRAFDAEHGIYIASSEVEMLLLLVRDALKRRSSAGLSWFRGKAASGDLAREFAWLLGRVSVDGVVNLANRLVGPEAEKSVRMILERGLGSEERRAFSAVVRPALSRHRTYRPLASAILVAFRKAFWAVGGLSRRRFHWAVPLRRVSPRGGICVAFVGSDGAGKSTVSAYTVAWLSKKLDVVPVYFGSGDGPSSVVRLPLQVARRLVDRRALGASSAQRRSGMRGRLRAIALPPWALALSLEKRSKLTRMVRARNRGLIIVCDRFPQDQFSEINDGRLLGKLAQSQWRLARSLSRWEAQPYWDVRFEPPDVVIKLIATPQVALSRRPEMSIEEIETRIRVVRGLHYPKHVKVTEIDADRPLEEVLCAVRDVIWSEM